MQLSEFLVVANLCCIILPCFAGEQNSRVSSWNPTVAENGKVTVNFGDLVIEVKSPKGREGIVNTQPIYERWENVDDVTYWESIYGSMDNIPAFEDLPDIPGETIELQSVREWDEEDPEEKPTEITDKDQSNGYVKNSSGKGDRSLSSTTDSEIIANSPKQDHCERVNPLFPTLKSWYREKREISVSPEEETDAEEALKVDPNPSRKGRTLSLLQSFGGKSRLKSNWRSDYLFNKYGRKSCRPYEYERGILGRSVDDCSHGYGITGADASAKLVDSAINAVELVSSGIAKTSQAVGRTIVDGAKQLAQAKRDVIDLGQEATQAIALGSLNNGAADCTAEEGIAGAAATNIDSGLEVLGNSVLDTNSGIINASRDWAVPVGITASHDPETKAEVDTVVGSVSDNDPTVGAEIISNSVAESNITSTVDEEADEEIGVMENEEQIGLQDDQIVEGPSVGEEVVGERLGDEEIVGEPSVGEDVVGKTLGDEEIVGETLGDEEIVGERSVGEDVVGETLGDEEIVGEPSVGEDVVGEPAIAEENVEETLGDEEIVEKTSVPEGEVASHSQVAGEKEVVSGPEPLVGSVLRVVTDSEANTSLNVGISTGSKTEVKAGKNRNSKPDRRGLGSHDLSYECSDSLENDRERQFCLQRRYYDQFDDEQQYRRRFPDRNRYRPNSQLHHERSRPGIHRDSEIQTSLNSEIGLTSNRGSISSATAASADLNSNLDIGPKSSFGVDSHSDFGRSRSNYRNYEHDRERLRHPEEYDSEKDVYDFDSEEYREFKRRFPNTRTRGHSLNSGTHADSGIRSSLDSGVGKKGNHGSIHTSTGASVNVDSNLNLGTSTSGLHIESGVHSSLDTSLNVNNGAHGGLHTGTRSSLNADSHLDVGRASSTNHGGNRGTLDDVHRNRNFCDCEDYEDYLEYRRRYPDMTEPEYQEARSGVHADAGIHSARNTAAHIQSNHGSVQTGTTASLSIETHLNTGISKSSELDSHPNIGRGELTNLDRHKIDGDSNRNEEICQCEDSEEYREYRRRYPAGRFRPRHGGLHNSGTHSNSRIHPSLDPGVDYKTGTHESGLRSGVHISSGIHSSLDTGVDLNSDTPGSHLHAEKKATLDAKSRFDVGRMGSSRPNGKYREYQRGDDISAEYDDYDDEREYERFLASRYRDDQPRVHSGIHTTSGIDGSIGAGVATNAIPSGGLQAGTKSSLNLDSHLDITTTTSAVNSAGGRQHFPHPINSAIRADSEIHTSHDTDINAAGHSHSGSKSSLAVDSHLGVGSRTNGAPGAHPRSEIMDDIKGPDGKLGEKICEAACRGNSDFQKHEPCPHSGFEPDGPTFICDNCRRRLHGPDHFCPDCDEEYDGFGDRLPFLSSGTIYHFDGLKQNCKRTTDSSEDIEPHPETKCGLKRYINLDANCSDEAFQQNPDCQNLDYNLQMPRDGNPVSLAIVRNHLSHGHDIALDMHDRARSLVAGGLHPYPHTASMLHLFHSKVPDDLVKLNEESELTLFGMKLLQHKLSLDHNITPNNFLEFLEHHGFRVTSDRICRGRQKRCGGYDKFRSLDGSCNNVAHPTWGQSNRAFARILPARYSDGIHGMPLSVTGAELPNPRKLSVRLYSRGTKPDPELTLAVMQWGQTLAHDLGRQVMDQTTNGGIECCADNGKRHLPKSLQHHSCAPITISPRDKFYSIHGQRCMNFVRAMTVRREDCTLGPADQLNGATSFLDCSSMYGPDKTTSDQLREFTGGRMKVEFRSGRWMLPTTTNQSNFCDIWTSDDVCYRTGDPRNNQNPQLVILQTMLVREHNRIADGLKALNQEWNDERIFQESRRIVIAEYQHITYNEWLPLLLGKRYVKKHGLNRTEPEMSSAYNERINPTTIIGFTSGAFRSLHSMIEGDIGLCNVGGQVIESLRLSDHFFRPKVIEKRNNFEHLLRGLASQRMQAQDMNLHRELTEYLFRSRNDYGMDLAAIDIQRGRDHGVPSYNSYRKICRLEPANDFDDLAEEISWENIEKLRRDYAHVDDIDLIVGATMENRAPGSLFGPTNRCLIGEQFYRSRVGDRYFYDNANLPHSFTPEQFHEITKVTLSRLMCDMGGAVVMVQRNAFRAISPKNPLVPCEDLPKLDLSLWKE